MSTDHEKIPHATTAWFEMLGGVMCAAAERAGLAPDHNVSVVEHFTDCRPLGDGLSVGFRFDIKNGIPSFRVGAKPDERGDITIDVTRAASRTLNTLHTSDPAYQAAAAEFMGSGAFKVEGDLSRLGNWLGPVHDEVVDRTA